MKKFWTDAKIAEAIEKKRVIKPQSERKPKTYLTNYTLSLLVSQRNGFIIDNVREVIDDLTEIIWEQILLGNRVYLPKMGSLYLAVKPPYKTNINLKGLGGELKEHYVAPRYDLRFYRSEEALFFLKQREVTEEELRKIYYDGITKKEKEVELVVENTSKGERKM